MVKKTKNKKDKNKASRPDVLEGLLPPDVRGDFLKHQESLDTPWASFEIAGFEDDGRIKVEFNFNDSFINTINELGFRGETPEDSVQLFFYASQLKPTELDGAQASVQSDNHPALNGSQNIVRV